MKHKANRVICRLFMVLLSLTMYSCGLREKPESISASEKDDPVPVAEFHDLRLPVPFLRVPVYTFNEEWFYFIIGTYDQERQGLRQDLYRNDPYGEFEPELYVARVEKTPITLLADRDNNCVLFSREENGSFSLEKYDDDGMLQWHREYPASELSGRGESLSDGIVTGDGRIFLYTHGKKGSVFVFGQDGVLRGIYTPKLEVLEGIAEGREGRVYGYCIAGEEPTFVDVEDGGEKYICPITPLQAYGGVRTGSTCASKRVCGNMTQRPGIQTGCGTGTMSMCRLTVSGCSGFSGEKRSYA